MTSALRLHDHTNAYLSMEHDVTKLAANEMVLKEVDDFFVLTNAFLWEWCPFLTKKVRLTSWRGHASLRKQRVNLELPEKKGREGCTRFVLKIAQLRARAHHLEQLDMSMIFTSHMLGARVREPRRWRPQMTNPPRGAEPAWNGLGGAATEQKTRSARPRTRRVQRR